MTAAAMGQMGLGQTGRITHFRITPSSFRSGFSHQLSVLLLLSPLSAASSLHSLSPALFHGIVSTPACYLPNFLSFPPLLIRAISLPKLSSAFPIAVFFTHYPPNSKCLIIILIPRSSFLRSSRAPPFPSPALSPLKLYTVSKRELFPNFSSFCSPTIHFSTF